MSTQVLDIISSNNTPVPEAVPEAEVSQETIAAPPRPEKPKLPEAEIFRKKFHNMTDRQLLGEAKRKAAQSPNLLGAAHRKISNENGR